MNNVMNYAPGAGSLARPVDQQSSTLPLCYGCPLSMQQENMVVTSPRQDRLSSTSLPAPQQTSVPAPFLCLQTQTSHFSVISSHLSAGKYSYMCYTACISSYLHYSSSSLSLLSLLFTLLFIIFIVIIIVI